jgi:hypothetical protein
VIGYIGVALLGYAILLAYRQKRVWASILFGLGVALIVYEVI